MTSIVGDLWVGVSPVMGCDSSCATAPKTCGGITDGLQASVTCEKHIFPSVSNCKLQLTSSMSIRCRML